ncbi:hypothetical protein [Bacillus massiliglaciei]|uniref:hypothetical protein n=1 Tax=Bacillus massiliglaciei TaxID=1816693 RepID=UPI000AE5443F|nr:hypothetical protein [Bacillus massiliglaciei]
MAYQANLALFLYFPEDKTEYIPAAITCIIFLLAAVVTMKLIMNYSKKEEQKTKLIEEQINKRYRHQRKKRHE